MDKLVYGENNRLNQEASPAILFSASSVLWAPAPRRVLPLLFRRADRSVSVCRSRKALLCCGSAARWAKVPRELHSPGTWRAPQTRVLPWSCLNNRTLVKNWTQARCTSGHSVALDFRLFMQRDSIRANFSVNPHLNVLSALKILMLCNGLDMQKRLGSSARSFHHFYRFVESLRLRLCLGYNICHVQVYIKRLFVAGSSQSCCSDEAANHNCCKKWWEYWMLKLTW